MTDPLLVIYAQHLSDRWAAAERRWRESDHYASSPALREMATAEKKLDELFAYLAAYPDPTGAAPTDKPPR